MEKSILTVFSDRDSQFLGEVIMSLHNHLELPGTLFVKAAHVAGAKQKILGEGPFDLIIIHVNIPIDDHSTDSHEMQGLRLLQELNDQGCHIPAVLFVPSNTSKLLAQANELLNCYVLDLMKYSENWQDVLIKRARVCLEDKSRCVWPQDEIKAVNVDITVDAEQKPTEFWNVAFNVIGGHPVNCQPVIIQVDSEQIELLFSLTRILDSMVKGSISNWTEALEQIGQQLGKVLLSDPEFKNRFDKLSVMGGGLDKFRIRFNVKKGAHPFIWEALAERRDHKCHYWMLKVPIYRTVWTSSDVTVYEPALFQKDINRAHNCLIIESNIGENYVESIERQYSRLKNIEDEVGFLAGFLPGKKGVGRVLKIPANGEICSRELVHNFLTKEGPWDIVHYAGHSYFGKYRLGKGGSGAWSDEKAGLLFFPGDKTGKVEPVTSELFSKWLRDARTRFIYLSSCHSSEESFLYELADRGIPAALGFRWDMKDDICKDHAKRFYQNLLKCRSLEYAFLKTRCDMYDTYQKKETIWAAPVLLLQI